MKKNSKKEANSGSSSHEDKTSSEIAGNKMRRSRRRLIQGLVAGGVVVTASSVPSKWSSPVVKAVTLPAHAQTSGALIRLGNDGNFRITSADDLEQRESLLASGVPQGWDEIAVIFVQQAHAQDDTQLICDYAGCSHIEFYSGASKGKLFISIIDLTLDNEGPRHLVYNFRDGQVTPFDEPCLPGGNPAFRVDLMTDDRAKLTLYFDLGGKIFREVDLVDDFDCDIDQGQPG